MRIADTPKRLARKVTVIIPCYNEAASIGEVIARIPYARLDHHGIELQILVVDNNSSDNTAEIAKKAGATVIHESKQGKGNALRTGFRSVSSDTDYVVMLDGDNTYDPEEVLRLIEPLRSDFCDAIIGSRLGGRIQTKAMNRLNLLGNRLFTTCVRLLYRANVTDALTGYFAWKKSALDALKPHITSAGFAIEMEMITKMARLGQRLAAVPISYDPRSGESHLRPFYDGMRILGMLLRNVRWRPPESRQLPAKPASRKIVFVSDGIYPYMKGGKEKRLHEITTRLAAMGYEVHIYTMHWWKEPAKTKVEHGVQLHALCKYYAMYRNGRRTIKEGICFGLACLKLFRVRFDVLDVDHMPFFPIFSAWIVCLTRRRKLYATWHEALSREEWMQYMGIPGLIAAQIERASIRLPYCITAASAHTQKQLQTAHGRIGRVELVASGVDISLLESVSPADVRCDVLYVGRLVKDKNVDKLILAVEIATQSYPDIRCIIIGDGPEKKRLQLLVRRYKLRKVITFIDPLPQATDVYAYMKAAKVFCSPSVREGFGITALEALACGTPVVTVKSPGNAAMHLIQEGDNGSIVPLQPEALARAIVHWASTPLEPNTVMPIEEYDWHSLAKKQAEVYMS